MQKTTEEIYEEMKAAFAKRSGVSIQDGGDMALRLYTVAAQIYSLWVQAAFLQRQGFPQTAEGEYLDRHAQSRGLQRNPAVAAEGILLFSIQEARTVDLQLPAGLCCATTDGVQFVTLQDGVIPAGRKNCVVKARAAEPGEQGNVAANTVCRMLQPPVGVQACTNVRPFSGGVAEESDESLRQRLLESYRKLPNGANRAYYETQAKSVRGVAAVEVLPRARGLGTVDLVIAAETGMPSGALVEQVRQLLEQQREICVDIQVAEPKAEMVDVFVQVEPESGYDSEAVLEQVRTALAGVFCGTLLSQGVLRAKLGNTVYTVPGVKNYILREPAADVPAAQGVLPVLGSLHAEVM